MSETRRRRVRELLASLTLEEKASLLSGDDLWTTKAIPRAGLPSLWLADGPHGVRKAPRGDHIGIGKSVPATCFPTLSALGASWDPALVRRVGAAIGREARALGVDVVLGPGVNLHRSPLGGRNFEYFSEDPELSGALGAAFVDGLQGEGVGASVKHYAANDQETGRMVVDAQVDERALRELHLRPFEIVVTKARPWTVMCAYNRVNGVFASEHPFLLHQVLVKEWGFDGLVVSDWGAVNDRVAGVRAGLHLEMPASGGVADRDVVEAARAGALDEERLDEIVRTILDVTLRAEEARRAAPPIASPAALPAALADVHHALVREAASQCVVLLENEHGLLPLDPSRAGSVAVIGRFAKEPRIQGGGSSQIVPARLTSAWDALTELAPGAFSYAPGTNDRHEADADAVEEARRVATAADVALVFVGLPPAMENEGSDRTHMDLPAAHDALVEAVAAVQPNLIVVIVAGAPVRLPWAGKARALVLAGLGGQAAGEGLADVLLGRADAGGRLATTWPRRIEDTPCFLSFPGDPQAVRYGESVFVGYRYYDTARVEPLLPFGHGLSYARFAWDDLSLGARTLRDGDMLEASLRLRNVGERAGSEVVQLYVHDVASRLRRPEQELRAFAKVRLAPGQETRVRLALDRRAFAFWDPQLGAWATEAGEFELRFGRSSRDIVLRETVRLEVPAPLRAPFDRHTPIRRFLADEVARAAFLPLVGSVVKALFGDAATPSGGAAREAGAADGASFFLELPVGKLVGLSRGAVSREALAQLLEAANRAPRGLD
jgi:beta-glucosidase